MPEEIGGTADAEVDLNDDAVGRSRYERFHSVCSRIMRQKIQVFEYVRESPVGWDAFEGTFASEVEATNSRTHFEQRISQSLPKFLIIPVDLLYFVM